MDSSVHDDRNVSSGLVKDEESHASPTSVSEEIVEISKPLSNETSAVSDEIIELSEANSGEATDISDEIIELSSPVAVEKKTAADHIVDMQPTEVNDEREAARQKAKRLCVKGWLLPIVARMTNLQSF